MRISLAILALLLLCGCPRAAEQAAEGETATTTPPSITPADTGAAVPDVDYHVALVFSETESDPWVNEMLNTLGADLGADLWEQPVAGQYFDLYGPYTVDRDYGRLTLDICLVGFTGVGDIAGQEVLGTAVLTWLDGLKPDLAWLDGDPVQFQVGSKLAAEVPVVFTGVVLERRLYYDYERPLTGVYERYSLPAVMGEIWSQAPEATHYALLVDDSATSAGRAQRFITYHSALPEGHEFVVPPAASSWQMLKDQVEEYRDEVDAFIFCGVGESGCSADFLENPCPVDLVVGLGKPAIVLGPSRMDHSGAISLRLKPSVHCRTALRLVDQVLQGADPLMIPSITPDNLGVFISEVDVKD